MNHLVTNNEDFQHSWSFPVHVKFSAATQMSTMWQLPPSQEDGACRAHQKHHRVLHYSLGQCWQCFWCHFSTSGLNHLLNIPKSFCPGERNLRMGYKGKPPMGYCHRAFQPKIFLNVNLKALRGLFASWNYVIYQIKKNILFNVFCCCSLQQWGLGLNATDKKEFEVTCRSAANTSK